MDMEDYWHNNYEVGEFGIQYLDEKLGGIARSDLILIGARSGAGKSSIANRIFSINCNQRKCVLFSLENFDGDLYSQSVYLKYKEYSSQFWITPRLWLMGKFKKDYDALERAEKEVKESLKSKYIITRQPEYTIQRLKDDMVKACEDDCQLMIIDHLDYVDKDNPTESDITHMTDLMKQIRYLQDTYKVAVVAISHLRKPENTRTKIIIPNENEFIGSSNKAKEATIVIMFAPDDDGNVANLNDNLKRTWCCIRKNRFGGTDNKCVNLQFNRMKEEYEPGYELHSVNYLGTETKFIKKVEGV